MRISLCSTSEGSAVITTMTEAFIIRKWHEHVTRTHAQTLTQTHMLKLLGSTVSVNKSGLFVAVDSSHSRSVRRNSHTSNSAWNVTHTHARTHLTHPCCIPWKAPLQTSQLSRGIPVRTPVGARYSTLSSCWREGLIPCILSLKLFLLRAYKHTHNINVFKPTF